MLRSLPLLSAVILASAGLCGAQTYAITQHWKIGGTGGWDYLAVDPSAHRLYVTHNMRVEVLDTVTGKVVGAIAGLTGTHGVAFDSDGKTGYISDGGANSVVVFDRANLSIKAHIPAGTNPDSIAFDPASKTVWAFNGHSKDATVIDARSLTVLATVKLPGRPEFAQVDERGALFVNLEDKNEIAKLDTASRSIVAVWSLAGCESPSGMAMDRTLHRLFSVCDGDKMAVTDYTTGKVIALAAIGGSPDAAGFDQNRKLAFSSNGEGTLTVIDTRQPGYPAMQTLKTAKGARTMAFDEATGAIYLSAAQYGPAPAPTAEHPHPRPSVLPGSFEVIVVRPVK
ncbi:MAG: YncE family protein [Acidobacteria bacterium]|nr:YncE family protein [Acidobacteriota bacterium]